MVWPRSTPVGNPVQEANSEAEEIGTEQLLYANMLQTGVYIGLTLLFITFLFYLTGIVEPYIPKERLESLYVLGTYDYLEVCQLETGWAWIRLLRYGDFVNFVGIALLAGVSILCYLSIIPVLVKKKDYLYVVLALLEVAVLCLAASGILEIGH